MPQEPLPVVQPVTTQDISRVLQPAFPGSQTQQLETYTRAQYPEQGFKD